MKPGIKLEGYKEAVAVFVQFPEQMQRKMLAQALRKSAAPMVSAVKSQAPQRKGNLRNSIRAVPLSRERVPTTVSIAVAPVFKFTKNSKVNAFYGRFLNDGTVERKTKHDYKNSRGKTVPKGTSRGSVKATHFMLNAFNVSSDTTVSVFGAELAHAVESFANKNLTKR